MSQQSKAIDTTQEALNILHSSLRKMSIPKKMDLIRQINKDIETIAIAGIKRSHPEYSSHQISYELTKRRYGKVLADLAYDNAIN